MGPGPLLEAIGYLVVRRPGEISHFRGLRTMAFVGYLTMGIATTCLTCLLPLQVARLFLASHFCFPLASGTLPGYHSHVRPRTWSAWTPAPGTSARPGPWPAKAGQPRWI